MYRNILKTAPQEECSYIPLDAYLKANLRPDRANNRVSCATAETHFLNTSHFAGFYRFVEETANMHGYMTTSTFTDFLTMVSLCITHTEVGADSEDSDA